MGGQTDVMVEEEILGGLREARSCEPARAGMRFGILHSCSPPSQLYRPLFLQNYIGHEEAS